MARILLVFSSADGQTEKIARTIARDLGERGHRTSLASAAEPGAFNDLAAHDGVIVGGAIRYGHHARSLERAVRSWATPLSTRPSAFFSVCLSAGGPGAKPEVASEYIREFVRRTGWHPDRVASFAGALLYTHYNFAIRFVMRLIVGMAGGETDTSRDYEYTDWTAVARFAADFAQRLEDDAMHRPAAAAVAVSG